jgi:hypothetical protein
VGIDAGDNDEAGQLYRACLMVTGDASWLSWIELSRNIKVTLQIDGAECFLALLDRGTLVQEQIGSAALTWRMIITEPPRLL